MTLRRPPSECKGSLTSGSTMNACMWWLAGSNHAAMETQESIDIVKLKRVALGQVSSAMIDPSTFAFFWLSDY